MHLSPAIGKNYYKLRQVDFDGRYEDTDIKSVTVREPSEQFNMRIFPNPAIDFIYVEFDEIKSIKKFQIVDINGIIIKEQVLNNVAKNFKIGIDTLTPSAYFLVLYDSAGNAIWKPFSKIRF